MVQYSIQWQTQRAIRRQVKDLRPNRRTIAIALAVWAFIVHLLPLEAAVALQTACDGDDFERSVLRLTQARTSELLGI